MNGLLTSRAVLSITGEDATTFLQGLLTQDLAGDGPFFTALLTPQGKILFDFFLVPSDGGYLIDCDAGAAPALLKRLTMYKLRARVTLAAEGGLGVFVGEGAGRTFPDPRLPSLPVRRISARAGAPSIDDAYDLHRLSLGVPEFGRDFFADEVFLLDVNYDALSAVSYKKGCFVGQEVTSRMKRKGEIRKRTLIVQGGALEKGAAILAGDGSIGELMSVRGDRGLALIRIDRLAEARASGAPLESGGVPVNLDWPAYL